MLLFDGSLDVGLSELCMIHEEIHHLGGISQIFEVSVLEGVVATRRTSGQTVGPRVCSYVLVTLEVSLARN